MSYDSTFEVNRFIYSCPYRRSEGGVSVCEIISENVGFKHTVHTRVCAQCYISGWPDPGQIATLSFRAIMIHLQYCYEGYHEKEETRLELFNRALLYAGSDAKNRAPILQYMYKTAQVGRLNQESIEKLHEIHNIQDKEGLLKALTTDKIEVPPIDYTPVVKAPCAGCQGVKPEEVPATGLGQKLVNAVTGPIKAVAAATGLTSEASPETIEERTKICQECTAVDTKGKRLYRKTFGVGVTCGAFGKILRDAAADGCGCILELKIKTEGETCPLKRW